MHLLRHGIEEGLYHIGIEGGHHGVLDDVERYGRVEVLDDEVHDGHLEVHVVDVEGGRGVLHLGLHVALDVGWDILHHGFHALLALLDAAVVEVEVGLIDVVARRACYVGTYGVGGIEGTYADFTLLEVDLYGTVVEAGDVAQGQLLGGCAFEGELVVYHGGCSDDYHLSVDKFLELHLLDGFFTVAELAAAHFAPDDELSLLCRSQGDYGQQC